MKWRRELCWIAVLVAVVLGVVITRAFREGRAALAAGDGAQRAGNAAEAITAWRRAARWYVPGAPHVAAAYERLRTLAAAADRAGDEETALAAWTGVRSSILATRSFYLPHGELLGPANQRIAALLAARERRERAAAGAPGSDEQALREHHHRLLLRRDDPSTGWTLVALIGLATWLAGGFWFALRGVSEDDRLVPRCAARAGGTVALGLVLWMLGLALA
jgi:hypothetical protein